MMSSIIVVITELDCLINFMWFVDLLSQDAYAKYENAFEPENNAWLGALSLNPEQRRKKEMKE